MVSRAPAHTRPGQPEGAWWHPLAYLAALMGAGMLGWALVGGVVWLVWFAWLYFVVTGSLIVSLALVALVAHLALKHGWRPKVAAFALFCALVAFVLWVVPV